MIADCPLTPGQSLLWFAQQLNPQSSAWNISCVVRLLDPLDVRILQSVLSTLVDRHAAYRSRFTSSDGEPRQEFSSGTPLPFIQIDACGFSESDLTHLVQQHYAQPFDLERESPFRATLFRTGECDHVLLLLWHHIATDMWSLSLFLNEFDTLYLARLSGGNAQLPLARPYCDFVEWQRDFLESPAGQRAREYWERHLPLDLAPFTLPADRSRAQSDEMAATLPIEIGRGVTQAAKDLARETGVSLFSVLMAAFYTLLHRYTGSPDVLVNVPLSARTQHEFSNTSGYFANLAPLRITFEQNATFLTTVKRAHESILGAMEHQDYPVPFYLGQFPRRQPGEPVLTDVMFVLQQWHAFGGSLPGATRNREKNAPMRLGGMKTSQFPIEFASSAMELAVELFELDGALHGFARFRTPLFETERIAGLIEHFRNLLSAAVADPEQPVSKIDYLRPKERRKLTLDWNQTRRDYALHEHLADVFERQVERTPDAIAVLFGHETVTFRELNERADRLTSAITATGLGVRANVGIYLPRSLDSIVATLAVLKAGCIYVPLDPEYPQQRTQFMLGDSGVAAVITSRSLGAHLPEFVGDIVCVDELHVAPKLTCERDAETSFCILYTSGSTGAPKGVRCTQAGALNRCEWMWESYPFSPDDVVCHSSSPNFVDSHWQIFGPLLSGKPVAVIPPDTVKDPDHLVSELARLRVTRFVTVPSLLRVILQDHYAAWDRLPLLRHWSCSSEPLPKELAARFAAKMPGRTLINLYGCSEASADSACYEVTSAGDPADVLIGKPIANSRIYILDQNRQLLPAGIPGEVYIAGAGLAEGYLNRPDLTAERFVSDPFGEHPSERMYRTGDLARYRNDGNIEYLGRTDHQVKIRGYRIETGEIESVIAEHGGVQSAIVRAFDTEDGDRRLVAYVIADDAAGPSREVLREHVRTRLPHYMRPASYVFLKELPLLSNGKIDWKALPLPGVAEPAAEGTQAAPVTQTEESVSAVFAELLHSAKPGVNESFFDLGGHSLLATQAVARLRNIFHIDVPLRLVFEKPTVRALSREIDQALRTAPPARVVPRVERSARMPLSSAQERLWFLHRLAPNSAIHNISGALRLRGALNIDAMRRAFQNIIDRHESLRTRFYDTGAGPATEVIGDVAFEIRQIDLSAQRTTPDEITKRLEEEAQQPFDLQTPPLLRCAVVRIAPDDHVVLTAVHHIVADAWSLGVLLREFSACYLAELQDLPANLPALSIQFADYAAFERTWGEQNGRELSFWRENLKDAPSLQLPSSRSAPKEASLRSNRIVKELGVQARQSLRTMLRQEGVTVFTALFAAWSAFLCRICGQDDVLLGTTVANRGIPETESLIGRFANVLPLRLRFDGDPTFRELVLRAREVCLNAFAHEQVPFDKILQVSGAAREGGRHPLVRVLITEHNIPLRAPELPGLASEAWPLLPRASLFDLNLTVDELASGGLRLVLDYSEDLYDQRAAEDLLRDFETLLGAAVRNPDTRISRLPASETDSETRIAPRRGRSRSILEAIDGYAATISDAIALRVKGADVSYSRAWRQILATACVLKNTETTGNVGVLLRDAGESLIACLGVMQAELVCVPLDMDSSENELGFRALNSNVTAILCDTESRALAQRIAPNATLLSNSSDSEISAFSPVALETAACLLYTSGQEGVSKGALHTQSFLADAAEAYAAPAGDMGRGDVLALCISPAHHSWFTAAIAALARGATVWDANQISEQNWPLVTLLHTSSVRFGACVYLSAARTITITGGCLRFEDIEFIRARVPAACDLVNIYGTAETGPACAHKIKFPLASHEEIPIGVPIAGWEYLLLDENGYRATTTGELALFRRDVRSEYYDDSLLTTATFISHPEIADTTIFKTGDRVRLRADGALVVTGRRERPSTPARGLPATAAQSAVEQVLSDIWQDALGRERIDPDANFFTVGGTAQIASQALAEMRAAMGVRLPLRLMYEAPTLRKMADRLAHQPEASRIIQRCELLIRLAVSDS